MPLAGAVGVEIARRCLQCGLYRLGRLPALFKVGLSLAGRSQLPTGFPARPARRSWPAQAACTLGSSGSSWSQCCWLRSPPLCSPSSLLRQSILTAFVNLFPEACSDSGCLDGHFCAVGRPCAGRCLTALSAPAESWDGPACLLGTLCLSGNVRPAL